MDVIPIYPRSGSDPTPAFVYQDSTKLNFCATFQQNVERECGEPGVGEDTLALPLSLTDTVAVSLTVTLAGKFLKIV